MLRQALERISFGSKIKRVSDVYETRSRHKEFKEPYLNCCVEIETDMTSLQIMQFLLETEKQLTEVKQTVRYHHRALDCDLIAYDSEVIRTPSLTLPHPDAHRRAFVMIPLSEIRPDWVHPVIGKTAAALAQEAFWPGWGSFFAHGKSLLDF